MIATFGWFSLIGPKNAQVHIVQTASFTDPQLVILD